MSESLGMAKGTAVSDYRLQYLHSSRKFIRQDPVTAVTDDEAIAVATQEWHLSRRAELWKGSRLVAKLSPRPSRRSQRAKNSPEQLSR